LLGAAKADFALSTITGPARVVTIRRTALTTRALSIRGRQDLNAFKKVTINRFQWDEAVRPVLQQEQFDLRSPINRALMDQGSANQIIEWIGLALEQSFIDAGYGPTASFPDPTLPFVPTDLADLDLWLDASDSATLVLDGGSGVERWLNKTTNTFHASQHVLAEQPTLTAAGLNGLDVIDFDGTADHLTLPLPAVNDWTLFVVGKYLFSGLSDRGSWLSAAGFDGSFGGIDARVFQNAAITTAGLLYSTVAGEDRIGTSALADDTWAILEYDEKLDHSGTVRAGWNVGFGGNDLETIYNGSTLNDGWDPTRQLFGESPPILASIGRYLGSINGATDGPAYLHGSVAELLLYTRVLSEDERASVRAYLRGKWAL